MGKGYLYNKWCQKILYMCVCVCVCVYIYIYIKPQPKFHILFQILKGDAVKVLLSICQ